MSAGLRVQSVATTLLVVYRHILGHAPRTQKSCASISGISGRSRERNRVAHVGEARDVRDGALEAEAKTRVRHCTVAAQISVPAVVLFVDAPLRHACIQYLEALLALAAADDLTDPGCKHIHSSSCSAVVIRAHVKRLDALRVVHHDHWLLRMLLREIALVFRLQIHAPAYWELELFLCPFKHRDRLAVVH